MTNEEAPPGAWRDPRLDDRISLLCVLACAYPLADCCLFTSSDRDWGLLGVSFALVGVYEVYTWNSNKRITHEFVHVHNIRTAQW